MSPCTRADKLTARRWHACPKVGFIRVFTPRAQYTTTNTAYRCVILIFPFSVKRMRRRSRPFRTPHFQLSLSPGTLPAHTSSFSGVRRRPPRPQTRASLRCLCILGSPGRFRRANEIGSCCVLHHSHGRTRVAPAHARAPAPLVVSSLPMLFSSYPQIQSWLLTPIKKCGET